MRMAALASYFKNKELSASRKFKFVCINKESLNGTRKSFEEIVFSPVRIACLKVDLCILCLFEELRALLYFRNATSTIALDKGVCFSLLVCICFAKHM